MKSETVGLSKARLERLDRVMKRRYVDSGRLPGVLTLVYRRGELVHTGMSGHMDLERDKPMREDAIFRIYSMSKPITAVALMMLVEEGLIGLDDDVATHIPSWKNLRRLRHRPAEPGGRRAAGQFITTPPRAADEGGRPGHAHLRPDLRLHDRAPASTPPIASRRSPTSRRRAASTR